MRGQIPFGQMRRRDRPQIGKMTVRTATLSLETLRLRGGGSKEQTRHDRQRQPDKA